MRILVVSHYFWPENHRINDLAIGLHERGYEVTVFTGIPNYPAGQFFSGYGVFKNTRQDYQGLKVIRAPVIPRGKGGKFRLILNFLSHALLASILAPFYCPGKFDLIFVYAPSPITVGLPALVLKKIKSVPLMFWVQDLWPESLSATKQNLSDITMKMIEKTVRFIYKGCDQILVQSRAFFTPIERLGIESDRMTYFPNSAEELYQPVTVEQNAPERVLLPDGFRVTFAGNIGAAQDFDTILTAAEYFRNHKDIHLVVLGDGRMFPWVQEQVRMRDLENTVHLLGRHPVELMPRHFSLSDALLVTLRKEPVFALTIPSKVQSYLACAKPIIAALDGEGARIIEGSGAGVTCPPEDPKALAETVFKLYNMSATDREKMGQKGRSYFEKNFERNTLIDRLEEWIHERTPSFDRSEI